ncbi:hypothetical protein ACIBG8_03960 [Nonomuraea sp. NPDC050556]|uniref:hypothetical protein n=1 Tax=Nonomuraea sp. NPDC050556 TaxID=3364369 RepID=UPI0037B23F93
MLRSLIVAAMVTLGVVFPGTVALAEPIPASSPEVTVPEGAASDEPADQPSEEPSSGEPTVEPTVSPSADPTPEPSPTPTTAVELSLSSGSPKSGERFEIAVSPSDASLLGPLVQYAYGSKSVSMTRVAGQLRWRSTAPAVQAPTTAKATLTARDAAGKRVTVATLDFFITPNPDAPPVINWINPKDLDGGQLGNAQVSVSTYSGLGLKEVTLSLDGTAHPLQHSVLAMYEGSFPVHKVAEKTSATLTVTATDNNGTVVRRDAPVTIWPANPPVLTSVTALSPTAEPGGKVTLQATATTDAHYNLLEVPVHQGDRLLTTLSYGPQGTYSGELTLPADAPLGQLALTARARDHYGQLSAEVPFQVAVVPSTAPQIISAQVNPARAAVGQKVTYQAVVSSPKGLESAAVQITNVGVAEIERVDGDAKRGRYEGSWTTFGPGEHTVTMSFTDVNQRTVTRTLPVTVVAASQAKIGSATATAVTVVPGSAKSTITVKTAGSVGKVRVTCGASAFTLARVASGTYRTTASLPVTTPSGALACAATAYDTSGVPGQAKAFTVTVKRASRLSTFNAAPEPVRRGAGLSVTGTLQAVTASGTTYGALGGARVDVLFRRTGSSSYVRLASVTTAGSGTFGGRFVAKRDGYWKVVYGGTGAYTSATSRVDYVDVR